VAFLGPIGTPELIIIMVVLLLLFGAKRLPEMGRSVGRGMREFKDAVTGDGKEDAKPAELDPPAELEDEPAEPAENAGERETVR
jgi:sec-independent protein translocase protein TatA